LGNERKFDPVDEGIKSQKMAHNEHYLFLSPGQTCASSRGNTGWAA